MICSLLFLMFLSHVVAGSLKGLQMLLNFFRKIEYVSMLLWLFVRIEDTYPRYADWRASRMVHL